MNANPDAGEGAFSFQRRTDGTVIISYHEAPVAALRGTAAARFIARVDATDASAAQRLMARTTGGGGGRPSTG